LVVCLLLLSGRLISIPGFANRIRTCFLFKILRSADAADDGIHVLVGDARRTSLQSLGKQFSNAAFDVVDDFIPTFFVGEVASQTLDVLLQSIISLLFDRYDPALKIYVDNLFHCEMF